MFRVARFSGRLGPIFGIFSDVLGRLSDVSEEAGPDVSDVPFAPSLLRVVLS